MYVLIFLSFLIFLIQCNLKNPACRLAFKDSFMTLPLNNSLTLIVIAYDADNNVTTLPGPLVWSSSDSLTVAVTSEGVVTGIKAGTATIRAESGTLSATLDIQVTGTATRIEITSK